MQIPRQLSSTPRTSPSKNGSNELPGPVGPPTDGLSPDELGPPPGNHRPSDHDPDFPPFSNDLWPPGSKSEFQPAQVQKPVSPSSGHGHKTVHENSETQSDTIFPNNVTFAVVALVIGVIVASFIVFLFVRKRRRNVKNVGTKLVPLQDGDEKRKLTNTIVSFKNEEQSFGFQDQCYRDSNDSSMLGKLNPNFMFHPKFVDNSWNAVQNPQVGTVPILPQGGLFKHPDANIFVSVPSNIVSTVRQIALVNGPPKNIPPELVNNPRNILSDMITMLPHNSTFDKHILISFPVDMNKVDNIEKIQLLYSNTATGEQPVWINLQQQKTPTSHKDAICWFISDGYCYLYANHFCHVFLTQYCTLVEQPALFLQASVHGLFKKAVNKLVVRVGLHCHKCNPYILEQKCDWGALLWSGYRCIYGKEGNVNIFLQMEGNDWIGSGNKQEIEVDDLMNVCNLNDIYPPHTFTYKSRSASTQQGEEAGSWVSLQVSLSQGDRKPATVDVDESLDNMLTKNKLNSPPIMFERKTSDPVEHSDSTLDPVENCDISSNAVEYRDENENTVFRTDERSAIDNSSNITSRQQTRTNILRTTAAPVENDVNELVMTQINQELSAITEETRVVPYTRKGDSIFSKYNHEDEIKLSALMDPVKTEKAPLVLKTVCETETSISEKNFNGQMVLQMWGLKVRINQRTWEKLRSILLDLKLSKVAEQLNITTDKEKLIHAIDGIAPNIRMEPLVSELLLNGVISPVDASRMRLMQNGTLKWLEYLVYRVLCKQPVSNMYRFYDVVQNMGEYKHLLKHLNQV